MRATQVQLVAYLTGLIQNNSDAEIQGFGSQKGLSTRTRVLEYRSISLNPH